MKRMVWMLPVLAIAILLVSCGGSGKDMQAGNGSQAKSGTDALVTINFWYNPANVEAGSPPDDWVVYDIVRKELGIELKLSPMPSNANDRDSKINVAGAANNLPDLFTVRRPVLVNLVKQGLAAEVDSMFAMMPTRTSLVYDADAIAVGSINGHAYGFVSSTGDIKANEGVLIRQDWLDRLGLDVPRTTEEYRDVMRAFTFNDPDGNGKNDTWGYGAFIEVTSSEGGLGRRLDPFMGAFGVEGTWNLSEMSAGLNVRKPQYYDAVSYIQSLHKEGIIDPNWLSYKKDDFKAAWKQGRFGMMREQHASFAAESNYAPFDKNFPEGEWIVIAPPVGPEGHSSVGVYSNTNDQMIAVSRTAEKAGKLPYIAKFLEWACTDGYYLLGWGEEGVNYVLDAQGVPTVAGLANPDLGFTKSNMQHYFQLKGLAYYWGDAELLSRYPSYVTAVSKKPMSALTTLREMQAMPWTKQAGVDLLPTPNPDVKRFYEQGVTEFITGNRQLTPENWKTFVAEFDRTGGKAWEEAGIQAARETGILVK